MKLPEEIIESSVVYQIEVFNSRFDREELGAHWQMSLNSYEDFVQAKIAVAKAREINNGLAYRIVQVEIRRAVCG